MTRTSSASDWRGAGWLGLFVLLTRIPFLSRSYGYDGDAWSVARAAREIASRHQYSYSRPPGFPLQEIACAGVWRMGPLATNGLTAFLSAVAAAFFYLICRQVGLRRTHAILASAALAFTPIVYVNSMVTLDYLWGLAFLMAGLYAACHGRAGWAGVAVGLAIGCRLTAAMMILPLAVLLAAAPRRRIVPFIGAACAVGAACYIPAFLSYGISFIRFSDESIPWALRARLIAYGTTLGLWGPLGLVGLGLAVVGMAWRRRSTLCEGLEPAVRRLLVSASVLAVLLGVLLFARLPVEYAYLIPIVPFVLLLILLLTPAPVARISLTLILVSPFVMHVDLDGAIHAEGALLRDTRLKREQLDSVERFAAIVEELQPDVLETGPEIDRFLAQEPSVPVVRSLSPEERIRRLDAGEIIYVLRMQGHLFVHGARLSADDQGDHIEVEPSVGARDQMLLAQLVPRPSARAQLFAQLAQARLFMAGTKSTVDDGGVLRERFGPTLVRIGGRTFLPLFTDRERARAFVTDETVIAPIRGGELPTLFTGISEIVLDPGTPFQCMVSLIEFQAYLTP